MRDVVEKLDELNRKYAEDMGEEYESVFAQSKSDTPVPAHIIALDGTSKLKCSAQMSEIYRIFDSWSDAFLGKTIVSPHMVKKLLEEESVRAAIDMIAKFSAPYPPSLKNDYKCTTIYAYDPEELRFAFFWWESADDSEPCIIDYDEGHIGVFASLKDHLYSLINEETATADGLSIEERIRNRVS